MLADIYNPGSPNFGHFLTVEEFTGRFGPSQEDYDAVVSFAKTHGLSVVQTSANRMNVDVTGSVSAIEAALHVTMGVYQHPTEDRTFYSADREPTPDLSAPLWHISGLDNYSIPRPLLSRRPAGAQPEATTGSCPSASFCGSDMRAAYYGGPLLGKGQSVGLLEYAGTDLADLATYYTNAGQTNNVPVTLVSTDGTSTSCLASAGCDDTEQTIDMTQALGMAPGLASLVMYVGSSDVAMFNAMATASPLNAQLSSSWTWTPVDPSTLNPYFEEFAAQGQNFFQAAGDSGKWGAGSEIWPADAAYDTSVGGTDLTTAGPGGAWSAETAWASGGGGISPNKIPIPSWQVSAAADCAACSKVYRNSPDVAANANYTFYVCADQTTCTANEYGGTSFAAPMWAGYLALANEKSLLDGGTVLGYINPAIYSIGLSSNYDTDFHDITSGSNGFGATAGYDLATGWGSPNGPALLEALVGKSGPGYSVTSSPGAITVHQSNSGTTTIATTVTGGFNSAITLSASGAPSGVTVSFNPTTITGAGTSAMTVAVGALVNPGTYEITVTGTSGATTAKTVVTLTVTGVTVGFTITAYPAAITVKQGASGTSTITTTVSGGYSSAISLSSSGGGSSQTVSFAPTSIPAPGNGTSTMTVKVGTKSAVGKHTITITGKGTGGVTEKTTVVVTVVK